MYRQFKMAANQIDLVQLIKEILQSELNEDVPFMPTDDIRECLDETNSEESPRETIFGFPTRPLYREIASVLHNWMVTKHCPILDLPKYELLDEKTHAETRASNIATITPMLEGLEALASLWTAEEKKHRIRQIVMLLGKRGLLDLLGIRHTVGTADVWPAPRKTIEASFMEKNNPNSDLTVGARALAKHGHRDESSSWWGVCTGSEADKNDHAKRIMTTILDNATWINIHHLPHDVIIVEARQEDGYGARWTSDGKFFRGFLEPQMVDGHEKGWRH